jgi:hypothetical protein
MGSRLLLSRAVIAAKTISACRGGSSEQVDADMFGANGRQRPGGFSYNIFLHEKGIK